MLLSGIFFMGKNMKKVLKIIGWTLLSLLVVVLLAASIAVWIVFSPQKLTPIVRNYAAEFVTCPHEIGSVELTFFSTFPNFGLQVDHVLLQNPLPSAPSDTVAYVDKLVAEINLRELWKNSSIVLNGLQLDGLRANIFVDADGTANYDVFVTDTTTSEPDTAAFSLPFEVIELQKIALRDIQVAYTDLSSRMSAAVSGMEADMELDLRDNVAKSLLTLSVPDLSFRMDSTDYLQHASLALNVPFEADLGNMRVLLQHASVMLNDYVLALDGSAAMPENGDILLDMAYRCKDWQVEPLLAMVPDGLDILPAGLDAAGILNLSGRVSGTFNDSLMPLVTADMLLDEGRFSMPEIPYRLSDLQLDLQAHVDLNRADSAWVRLNAVAAKTGRSSVELSGRIDKLLSDNMLFDLLCKARLNLPELQPLLPEDMDLSVQGMLDGRMTAAFSMQQLEKMDVGNMRINGKFTTNSLAVVYDSMQVNMGKTGLELTIPNRKPANEHVGFADVQLACGTLDMKQGTDMAAALQNSQITLQLSNVLADERYLSVACDFGFDGLAASMDDISAELQAPKGHAFVRMDMQDSTALPVVSANLAMAELKGNMDTISARIENLSLKVGMTGTRQDKSQLRLRVDYDCTALQASMGNFVQAKTNNLGLVANAYYNAAGENLLLQWNPRLDVDLQEGKINMEGFPETIVIPDIKFNFNNRRFTIDDSRIVLGNSDFQLKGEIHNIADWLADKGLLTGELDFVSNMTDVNQLMEWTSGMGSETETDSTEVETAQVEETVPAEDAASEPDPYMVPKGVDLVLHTNIKEALVGKQVVRNLGGNLYVEDGTLILEEMGFVCNAARLQLTAMYKTPRKNHLYLGLDYHMMDIHIEELIDMIPEVDSILPMLRSFKGQAEFHIAAETYLDGNYNLKKSTLRGASSIRGYDLVLMDGETFSEIAKILMFKKKTENKVDSISADLTIFRNEVDIYPFLVTMDKYQAAVGGRHNLDMTFDYHISLLRPLRIGVDVKGNFDDMRIRPTKCKYAEDFKPAERKDVETQRMQLRQLIYNSLTRNVKTE